MLIETKTGAVDRRVKESEYCTVHVKAFLDGVGVGTNYGALDDVGVGTNYAEFESGSVLIYDHGDVEI